MIEKINNNSANLIIFHQNIQCIKNKTLDIEVYLSTLPVLPHLLCITEHWCLESEIDQIILNHYDLKSYFVRSASLHGGSCIFVKDDLSYERIEGISSLSVENHIECSAVASTTTKMIIICVYRPPKGSTEVFLKGVADIFEHCQSKFQNHRVVFCGDFNIDLLTDNMNSKLFRDIVKSFNMHPTVSEPTRVFKNSSSLIDNIFINPSDFMDFESSVCWSGLSDHLGQIIYLHAGADNEPKKQKCVYKTIISESKLATFRDVLVVGESWSGVYASKQPDDAYDYFSGVLVSLSKRLFIRKKVQYHKENQWITKGIRVSSKRKSELYYLYCRGFIKKDYYKLYCKILKNVVTQAKRIHNNSIILNAKNKCKQMWSTIRTNSGKKQKEESSILSNLAVSSGESKTETLNKINRFFIDQCSSDTAHHQHNINHGTSTHTNNYTESINPKTLFLYPTDHLEVRQVIGALKNTNSVGEDEVTVRLLKYISNEVAGPLAHIINLSFSTGVFPSKLKTTDIKLIHKKGDKNEINNYRPIALLSNISKIVERIIYNRLIAFLEKCDALSSFQNGFRKGKSTVRAVYQALIEIVESQNKNQTTLMACLDLSKAFDSVRHDLLLKKLENIGVRGIALKLLGSYLKDRPQCILEYDRNRDMKARSGKLFVKRGVPQGSILGPLLYIIYTNEIDRLIEEPVIQFADDTSLIVGGVDLEGAGLGVVRALDTLSGWFKANGLQLNMSKTNLIKFDYGLSNPLYTLEFEDIEVSSVPNAKFLGIIVDHRLDWRAHVEFVAGGLARCCYALRTLSALVSTEASLASYHAYVQSRIRYGLIFWGNSADAVRVFRLQKRALRNIFKLKSRDTCRPYFVEHGVLTLASLYIYEVTMFILKNQDLFEGCRLNHTYATRNKDHLKLTKLQYAYLQKNVPYSALQIFNKFPSEFKKLPLTRVRHLMKFFLVSKAYYSVQEFIDDADVDQIMNFKMSILC